MSWGGYILIGFLIASIFFIVAALALHWAHKNGQLRDLDAGATSIFDEEEPEGTVTDSFPKKQRKS
jgi:nitrogen fixation-related uncharacterized protein